MGKALAVSIVGHGFYVVVTLARTNDSHSVKAAKEIAHVSVVMVSFAANGAASFGSY